MRERRLGMKVWRRVLSVVLSVVMVTSLLTGFATEKHTASAAPAGTTDKFTKEEFQDCYAKVLLSAVGHGYRDGSGYGGAIRKDSGSGTPRITMAFQRTRIRCITRGSRSMLSALPNMPDTH